MPLLLSAVASAPVISRMLYEARPAVLSALAVMLPALYLGYPSSDPGSPLTSQAPCGYFLSSNPVLSLYQLSNESHMLIPLSGQLEISSVTSLSHVCLFLTPWTAAHQASLFITNSCSLLKLMPIESLMPSNRLILCALLCPVPHF